MGSECHYTYRPSTTSDSNYKYLYGPIDAATNPCFPVLYKYNDGDVFVVEKKISILPKGTILKLDPNFHSDCLEKEREKVSHDTRGGSNTRIKYNMYHTIKRKESIPPNVLNHEYTKDLRPEIAKVSSKISEVQTLTNTEGTPYDASIFIEKVNSSDKVLPPSVSSESSEIKIGKITQTGGELELHEVRKIGPDGKMVILNMTNPLPTVTKVTIGRVDFTTGCNRTIYTE